MGNGGSVLGFVLKTIAALVVIAVVAIVGIGVVIGYTLHKASTPPDVAAVATSAAVAAADQQAIRLIDDRLTTLTALAVDMTPAATSVEDVCGSEPGSTFGAAYGPVTCVRTVTRYFGFGGAVAARSEGWDKALRAAGWSSHEPSPQPSAWRRPMTYDDPSRVGLSVEWADRPQIPMDLGPYSQLDATYARAEQRVEPDTAAATVYRDSPHMAVAVLQLSYFDASVEPTPSPDNYHPCYSGSGTCVGG